VIILGWFYIYAQAHGRTMWMPGWVEGLRISLYVLFMNRLYVDELYQALGRGVMRVVHRIDKRDTGWS
jgi:NADH-quinone oxidoreductase subunit L